MIYLKNNTGEQNVFIPRRGGEGLDIKPLYQEKTIKITAPGTYEVIPDPGFTGLLKVVVEVQ